jgi:hypothetical protein
MPNKPDQAPGQGTDVERWPLDAALAYLRAGLSVIPIRPDGSKLSALSAWKPFERERASEDTARRWWANGKTGIAIIGGAVSGNLECIDFDRGELFAPWCELVEAQAPGLVARLCVVQTPREPSGYHVRYRCPEVTIPSNTRLAGEPFIDPKTGKQAVRTLVETRGEGGYAIAPGSPPTCHKTGHPYVHVSGPSLTQLLDVTPEQRETLIASARSFCRAAEAKTNGGDGGSKSGGEGLRPGDDFNHRGPDWQDLIARHGWEVAYQRSDGARLWRRPGKDGRGVSATTDFCKGQDGTDLLYVFSTNAHPFEGGKGYSKFRAYALLIHSGDYKAAARELGRQGYGDQRHERNGHPRGEETETWEEPVPLGSLRATPAFPTDCLPGWLADWVAAEAEATQTPPDLPALLSLAVCGAAVARKYRVQVRTGWVEPLNLFAVLSLPPGDRKSAVFADALWPVQEFERQEQARMAPVVAEAAATHRILEGRLKAAETKASKAADQADAMGARLGAIRLAKEVAAHVVPELPQVYCDDVTVEKLALLLARQGGRMLQASAEGTAFEIAKGRYSETANFEVYLKGHAGDSLRVGRVGREGDTVEQPALSVALTVQPNVIRGLAESATMRGRGFLARFLYGLPSSIVGGRKIRPSPVPASVVSHYWEYVLALWQLKVAAGKGDGSEARLLPFSGEADQALEQFERWLEPQLAEGEELSHLAGWANKLAGTCARVAGILHLAAAVADVAADQPTISPATALAAIRIGRDYLLPHAQAAFELMGTDTRLEDAKRLVGWLRNSVNSVNCVNGGPVLVVSQRDLHANVLGSRRTVEDVEAAVELLVKTGYLRPLSTETQQGPGRKASSRYAVNPWLAQHQKCHPRSHNSQNSQNGHAAGETHASRAGSGG